MIYIILEPDIFFVPLHLRWLSVSLYPSANIRDEDFLMKLQIDSLGTELIGEKIEKISASQN